MRPEFWAGVGAVCAVMMVLGAILAALLRHIKLMVRDELMDWLAKLNGTYLRTLVYNENRADVERRLERLESRRVA